METQEIIFELRTKIGLSQDQLGGNAAFEKFKKTLINEINALNVEGMPKLTKLNTLLGSYINLEYRFPTCDL